MYFLEFKYVLSDVLAVCESKVSPFTVCFGVRRISFRLKFRVQDLHCFLDFDTVFDEVLSASAAGYRDTVHSFELFPLPRLKICMVNSE